MNYSLANLNDVVITESFAGKIFGNEDPIGKTLFAEYEKPLVVSGIVKDFPAYSSIRLKPVSILMKREILKQNPFGLRAVLNIIQNSVSISLSLPWLFYQDRLNMSGQKTMDSTRINYLGGCPLAVGR